MALSNEEKAAIANTIYQQLGGNMFKFMTGARSVSRDGATLIVKLPCKPRTRGYGFNVTLNAMDTYDVTFVTVDRKFDVQKKEIEGVYADQLREVIERETGLRCSL